MAGEDVKGQILVIVASLLFAGQNIVLKILYADLEPTVAHAILLLHLRTAVMVVLWLGTMFWRRENPWQAMVQRQLPQRAGVLSSVCLCISLVALYIAISLLPAGVALTLFSIYPIVTSVWAWLYWQEPLSRRQWLLLAGVLLGVVLTAGDLSGAGGLWGSVWALVAGALYAAYGLMAQTAFAPGARYRAYTPLTFSGINFVIGWLATGGMVLVLWPELAVPNWAAVSWVSVMTAIAALIAFLCHNSGIQRIGAALAATLSASIPVFTALLGWLILRDQLQPWQVLGIAIVTVVIAVPQESARQGALTPERDPA